MIKNNKIQPGTKLNRLTIIKLHHQDKRWRRFYLCKCECGEIKIIQGSLMTSGNTKSCGCLSKEIKKSKLLPNNKGVVNQIILGYKRHAKDRGYKFNLSYNDVFNIIFKPCYYCGTEKSNLKITKNCKEGIRYNGIDRLNNKKNYTKYNTVPCCKQCNYAKRDLTKDEFILWINMVYKKAMADQWG